MAYPKFGPSPRILQKSQITGSKFDDYIGCTCEVSSMSMLWNVKVSHITDYNSRSKRDKFNDKHLHTLLRVVSVHFLHSMFGGTDWHLYCVSATSPTEIGFLYPVKDLIFINSLN